MILCARLFPPTTIATLVDSTVDTSSRAPNYNLDRVAALRLSVSPPTVYSIICLVMVVVVGLYTHSNVDMKQVHVSYLSFDEKLWGFEKIKRDVFVKCLPSPIWAHHHHLYNQHITSVHKDPSVRTVLIQSWPVT